MEAKKLKDEEVGSTMHLERANTKQQAKEKLKKKEKRTKQYIAEVTV